MRHSAATRNCHGSNIALAPLRRISRLLNNADRQRRCRGGSARILYLRQDAEQVASSAALDRRIASLHCAGSKDCQLPLCWFEGLPASTDAHHTCSPPAACPAADQIRHICSIAQLVLWSLRRRGIVAASHLGSHRGHLADGQKRKGRLCFGDLSSHIYGGHNPRHSHQGEWWAARSHCCET